MRERLFQPLGISTGGFGAPGSADKTEQAWGHSPVLGKPLDPRSTSAEIPLFYGPAGLAHMTVTDWWVIRGLNFLATGDAAPAVTYCAGWFISAASWAKGAQPGDTGRRLWHAGGNGRWNCGVFIAPEIDFAVLVACTRGIAAAWKTRQTVRALIRTFAPKRTS